MKRLLFALACTQIAGCWFIFVPGSVIDRLTGNTGNMCVTDAATVGNVVRKTDGTTVKVVAIAGASTRCTDARWPILATGQEM